MTSSIDQKVVSMKFDNADFERRVAQTQGTLSKLKSHLDFSGSAKSMNNLSDAARGFNMNPLTTSIEGVSAGFLSLATIAVTSLARITNAAIDAGINFTKSFVFGGITDGFKEFETNMNSIQTILANTKSKGSTLEDVNGALDQLNAYSDKTIYNFSEMARNIGTFTAAGVGLQESVNSIKGIANLAAISGSSSAQASTAMYQLSQALAAGKVSLMDWNSVVNAGMGGEVFKKALFETGKAMKTVTNVPVSATFEEWEKAGGTFREQLQDGWLTADVLSTTLEAFSGDLDEATLKSMGFSEAAAKQMIELGDLGIAAATEVKTFTQLIGTIKEAIGSGWSQSFRIIVGDFEESKKLFSGIYKYISGLIGNSAKARNEMLQAWKDFGGRDALINSLRTAFKGILTIIRPIMKAFRDIFPKKTAADLLIMTQRFGEFAKKIAISGETAQKIRSIFGGLFSIFRIGWEVIKGVFSLFGDVVKALSPAGEAAGTFGEKMGSWIIVARQFLVEGGAIQRFFDNIGSYIQPAVDGIMDFVDAIRSWFDNGANADDAGEGIKNAFESLGNAASRVSERVRSFGDVLSRIGDFFRSLYQAVKPIIDKLTEVVTTFFGHLKEGFENAEFTGLGDILNVGLIGAGILVLKKLGDAISNFKLDVGGGLFGSIKNSFDELTKTLSAMQMKLKAEALMKLAIAIGVLTASVLVLSTIDSASLTKALTAMAVGMGQLMASMALMNKMDVSGAKMSALAVALGLLAGALLVMSLAVKILSTMSLKELGKGLLGIGVMLDFMIRTSQNMSKESKGMIAASTAMIGMAIALNIMAGAVKLFSMMSWEEMGQGLAGVAAALVILTVAANNMPKGMVAQGAGLIATAIALNILAGAVKIFATMSWEEMGKGMAGIAGGLLIIGAAMHAMPPNMLLLGPGLLAVSVALNVMALAVKQFGGMSLEELGKGIGSIAAMLLILAVATNAMSGALLGAAAIVVVAGALKILAGVIVTLAALNLGDLAIAMGALTAVLLILGAAALGAAQIAPALFIFAGALLAIGAAFILFGAGAFLAAKAFEIFVNNAGKGPEAITRMLSAVVKQVPMVAKALAEGILEFAQAVLDGLPAIIEALGIVIEALLKTIIDFLPELGKTISMLIGEVIQIVRDNIPDLIAAGIEIILALLHGIEQNIEEITVTVINIITKFVDTLTDNMDQIVAAGVNLIVAFLSGLAQNAGQIVTAAMGLIVSFINAISANLFMVIEAGKNLIINFLLGIGGAIMDIVNAGANILIQLLFGIASKIGDIAGAVTTIITTLINEFAAHATEIMNAGVGAFLTFMSGLLSNLQAIIDAGADFIGSLIEGIGSAIDQVRQKGVAAVIKFIAGIGESAQDLIRAGIKAVKDFLEGLGRDVREFTNAAGKFMVNLLDAIADAIELYMPQLQAQGRRIAFAIADGMTGGMLSKAGDVARGAAGLGGKAVDAITGLFRSNSPSKLFRDIGKDVGAGLVLGLSDRSQNGSVRDAAIAMADNAVEAFNSTLKNMTNKMPVLENTNPVIAPVLDLTRVESEAKRLSDMMSVKPITVDTSFNQASYIAHTTDQSSGETTAPQEVVKEIKFEQNITSPKALSTADIYRNTKSQIALAKEELKI